MGGPAHGACPEDVAASDDPRTHQGPLFCLSDLQDIDDADDRRLARARMNDLLARAVLAARITTGAGLNGMVFPYYSTTSAYQYEAKANSFDWSLVPDSAPTAYAATTGEYFVDAANGDLDNGGYKDAAFLGSGFAYVDGDSGVPGEVCTNLPAGAEWSRCPYDRDIVSGGPCLVFDGSGDPSGGDCDDLLLGPDRNMPFILREADRGLTNNSAVPTAVAAWESLEMRGLFEDSGGYGRSELRARLVPDRMARLTRYFDDWSIGGHEPQNYESHVEGRSYWRLLERGNRAFVGSGGLTVNDFLNGVELTCWAAREGLPLDSTNCDDPGEVTNLADAYRMQGYLECRAAEVSQYAASVLVKDLPVRVVEALRREGTSSLGGGAGEFDAQVSELRAALIELSTFRNDIAADLRAFSARIDGVRTIVSRSDRAREIEMIQFEMREVDRIARCATAIANAATIDAAKAAGAGVAAGIECGSGLHQGIRDLQLVALRDANVEDEVISAFADFSGDAAEFNRRMMNRASSLRAAFERIDAALARLRAIQMQARQALARALMLADDGTGRHFAVNRVYRARYSTLLERYRRAHQRAIRAAFIARLALEQRIGMPLESIQADVFSGESPQDWVDTLCTLPSIDYDRVRATGTRGEDETTVPEDYEGAYVGDYIRRLADLFESYSFVHPFREGLDTAVISLRDDVMRISAPCRIESTNLLPHGGRLDVFAGAERPGWRVEGCDVAAGVAAESSDLKCVSITRRAGDAMSSPTTIEAAEFGRPTPYLIGFGDPNDGVTHFGPNGDVTRLQQVVRVGPGRYRLSAWMGSTDFAGTQAWTVVVRDDTTGVLLSNPETEYFSERAPNNWRRVWTFFELDSATDVQISVPMAVSDAGPLISEVNVAGVMLEDVTGSVVGDITSDLGQRAAPGHYIDSDDERMVEVRNCPDHRGVHFRSKAWDYGCVRICNDGYGGNCPEESAETRCYRQTSFGVSADSLANMLVAGDAGFAAGNYNYRVESVQVNLVGTGLRDCERRGTSGCYGSGSASYSVVHLGPYLVRNARGELFDAPLFPGRVESARALAAERYITNPISNADRALLEPFTRYELQGRPLDGSFVLRLWDEPTFRFDRLEDVQFVLTYRYWQHQR